MHEQGLNNRAAFDEQLSASYMIAFRNKLFFMVICLVMVLVFALIAIIALSLTKRTTLIPILVNQTTGQVSMVETSIKNISMDTMMAMDTQYINSYVIARERYIPEFIEQDYQLVERFTCDKHTLDEAFKTVDLASADNYFVRYPNSRVQPEIESINFLNTGADIYPADQRGSIRYYTVFLTRHITGRQFSSPRYQISIGVDYTERTEEAAKKRVNPFGFCVYAYNKTRIVKEATQ